MKKVFVTSIALLFGAAVQAQAAPVTIDFEFEITSSTTSASIGVVPNYKLGTGTAVFLNEVTSVQDFGQNTVTHFEPKVVITTNYDEVFGVNQYANSMRTGSNRGTITDSPQHFYESAALTSKESSWPTTTVSSVNDPSWLKSTFLIATKIGGPQNGDGTSDYAFTETSYLDYWKSFLDPQAGNVLVSQSFSSTDIKTIKEYKWLGKATIISVNGETQAAPVPEPATMLLFGSGLFSLVVARRKLGSKKVN